MAKFNALVVLGKLLLNGEITPEYSSRVLAAVDYLKRNPWPGLVVFCGGNNGSRLAEACAGADYFKELVDFPEERVYRETHSRNTLENILKTIAHIKDCIHAAPEEVALLVITQKYHHERISRIGGLMKNFSLSAAVEKEGMSYCAVEAAYPYPRTSSPFERWCTEIYLSADRASVCQLNIESFVSGQSEKIYPCLVESLQRECSNFARLVSVMPCSSIDDKAVSLARLVSGELGESILPACHRMSDVCGRSIEKKESENLEYAGMLLKKSICAIREASDPDRLAFEVKNG